MKKEMISYIPRRWIEHGGALAKSVRKSKRPLNPKKPCHMVLRSQIARGNRALTKHRALVDSIIKRSAARFQIRVHKLAVCSNHIHLLVQGKRRIDLQNFFRVVAGHTAQEVLRRCPLESRKRGNAQDMKEKKYERRFWEQLTYTRIVNWGRDFATVKSYIYQNVLEALYIIPYQERSRRYNSS